MDIRNVQKTGEMFYIYLPTKWCRRYNIDSKSKVMIQVNSEGALCLIPQLKERKPKHLTIKLNEKNQEILHKILVAAYINPANSFKIEMEKELDLTKILDQKKLLSLELVELDGKQITCESSVSVQDPNALLTTMLKKIRNMLTILTKEHSRELVERYEEEIDRSRLLIEKSVINYLTGNEAPKLKTIELHYISLISTMLERFADHIIKIKESEPYFKEIHSRIKQLHELIENSASLEETIEFAREIDQIKKVRVKDVQTYDKRRVTSTLNNIADVMLDWAITKKLE